MPPQDFAFATPDTEEITKVAVTGVAAGFTGMVEGVMVSMAPQMGTLQPMVEWATYLGVPLLAIAGALFTKGMVADALTGVACGGMGVLGMKLPDLMAAGIPGFAGGRPPGSVPGGARVKQLGAGNPAAVRAQQAARVGASSLEF